MRYAAVGLGLLMMLMSDTVMAACSHGVDVFRQSVLPALFPMMILCGLMGRLRPAQGPKWLIYAETGVFCLLSGSPAGAKRVNAFVQNDEHFTRNALVMMAFCGVMSPVFFLGTLQSRLPQGFGLILLLCHWLGAAVTGMAALCICPHASIKHSSKLILPNTSPADCDSHTPLLRALPAALTDAMGSLLSVLGAMMVMGVAAALLERGLSLLLPEKWQSPLFFAILHALMEIGGGAVRLTEVCPDAPLLCGLCSFGGLSLWMQCLLFLPKEIHPGKLLLLRLFHGAVSYGLCAFAMMIQVWIG